MFPVARLKKTVRELLKYEKLLETIYLISVRRSRKKGEKKRKKRLLDQVLTTSPLVKKPVAVPHTKADFDEHLFSLSNWLKHLYFVISRISYF
jgi:hypothetical protein